MSDKTIWVILTDGRYIRVLYNKESGNQLLTLKADNCQALADLSYEVVRGVKPNATNGTASKTKTNMQLLSDFLQGQKDESQYDALIIAAPQATLDELKSELPSSISSLICGEVAEDIIAKSIDELEKQMSELLK